MENSIAFFSWIFMATNIGRVFAYGPQIRAAMVCPHGAQSISRFTWSFFALSHATVSAYGFIVLKDAAMGLIFLGNCIACCALVAVVSLRRAGRGPWFTGAPGTHTDRGPGFLLAAALCCTAIVIGRCRDRALRVQPGAGGVETVACSTTPAWHTRSRPSSLAR